jgi:hypothetical protein
LKQQARAEALWRGGYGFFEEAGELKTLNPGEAPASPRFRAKKRRLWPAMIPAQIWLALATNARAAPWS